jgi:Cu+-exporting ATPase
MAKDPICGMTVDEATALKAERDGQTFYFCSEDCRKKFLAGAEPTSGGEDAHEPHDHSNHSHEHAALKPSTAAKYYCPMCPGVESDKPGECPKCGMALERNPAWIAPAMGKTIYTCPMHPEVQQDHPGDCPKCGMPLELITPAAGPDGEEHSELRDMTRRLWIGSRQLGDERRVALDSIRPGHRRRLLGGLAVLQTRLAFAADVELEHVHAHHPRRGRGIHL